MIDLKEVGVAIGVGAAAGAVAPVVATTWAGAAILGGLSNVAQMLIVNKIENKCTTAKGAAWALGTGLVGGLVGGKFPSGNVFSTTSPYLDKGIASAANNQISLVKLRPEEALQGILEGP